jgi:hypothetical protein
MELIEIKGIPFDSDDRPFARKGPNMELLTWVPLRHRTWFAG